MTLFAIGIDETLHVRYDNLKILMNEKGLLVVRIAICDDDISSLELIYHLVTGILVEKGTDEFLVRRFHSSYDLLECLENPNLSFNVYFLDILMPMYNGIEVGREIRKYDEDAVIVYTTSAGEFALDASETAPLHYLVKPIQPEKLRETLESAIRKVEPLTSKNLLIKRKEGMSNIRLHQIEYVEYRDHQLKFYLSDGKVIPSRVIQDSFSSVVEHTLADARFLKPHASYAVNMDHVSGMSSREFEMQSGALVPISKRVYSQVRRRFVDYMVSRKDARII